MARNRTPLSILLTVLFLLPLSVSAASSVRAVSWNRYSKAHSLGDSYIFDPRDGWMSVNATNLQYKYTHGPHLNPSNSMERRDRSKLGLGKLINKVWEGLKGFGKTQTVKITWYIVITIGEMIFVRLRYDSPT
jgi:hypothetical protein